jgi:hypothetical protein
MHLVTNSTADGYLALFDPDGNQVQATRADLLAIEAMTIGKQQLRRIVGGHSGRYWLISDRPGLYAMVLEIHIFHCYPREGDEWSLSFCEEGIAASPSFDLDWVLTVPFSEKTWCREDWDRRAIPAGVASIARQRVKFRAGRLPDHDQPAPYTLQLRDAVELRQRLTGFLDGLAGPDELIAQVAGRRVRIAELMIVVLDFCHRHHLASSLQDILLILVPEDQHDRMKMQVAALGHYLNAS